MFTPPCVLPRPLLVPEGIPLENLAVMASGAPLPRGLVDAWQQRRPLTQLQLELLGLVPCSARAVAAHLARQPTAAAVPVPGGGLPPPELRIGLSAARYAAFRDEQRAPLPLIERSNRAGDYFLRHLLPSDGWRRPVAAGVLQLDRHVRDAAGIDAAAALIDALESHDVVVRTLPDPDKRSADDGRSAWDSIWSSWRHGDDILEVRSLRRLDQAVAAALGEAGLSAADSAVRRARYGEWADYVRVVFAEAQRLRLMRLAEAYGDMVARQRERLQHPRGHAVRDMVLAPVAPDDLPKAATQQAVCAGRAAQYGNLLASQRDPASPESVIAYLELEHIDRRAALRRQHGAAACDAPGSHLFRRDERLLTLEAQMACLRGAPSHQALSTRPRDGVTW